MKYFFIYGGILLFIIAGLFSCRPQESPSADNEIVFDTIRTVQNYHLDNDSTKPSCNLKIAFVYPSEYKNEAALKSLQDIFISHFLDESYIGLSPENAVESYKKAYIENYIEDARIFSREKYEHDDSEVYSSYYEIDNNSVTFNKGGIVSFQKSRTNYKGGAASYDLIENFNIDLKTTKLIMEDDIFNEGYEKALGVIFKDHLLKINKVKTVFDLENLGYFDVEEIMPNGNFLLDDTGITYLFNRGEHSGYKLDPITVFIPYKDITPLIKEGSVISKFVSI